MGDIESASAETAIQDSAGNAEIEMENSASNDIENQYNGLVNHIAGMLEGVKSTSSSERCIFSVPIKVRKIKEAAYTPRIVSIGPFHHGSERLRSMEAQKLCYFKKLIERGDVRLEDYVRLVKEQEQRIHCCYAEIYSNKLPLSGDDFLTMILVDAGFIIELLLRSKFYKLGDENDYLFNDSLLNDLNHDLTLLENQLPFFILDSLFNLTFAPVPDKFPPLLELCLYPDNNYITNYTVLMDDLINTPKDVDLLVQNGILVDWLRDSGTAATFFNSLCTEITVSSKNFYFSSLCKDLNAYYKDPWHMWKATLKRDYFSTPWRIASTTAAIILLVLTFIQTVCSILSLKRA